MLIVGIAGGTGSGKTTVVRKIMEVLISIIEKYLLKSKS
jgi:uridine kinase